MSRQLCAITATCCFAALAAAYPATPPKIDWIDCHQQVPPPLSTNFPDANLNTLPSTLKCGQLVVPMDYSKPISTSNNITLGLAMYRPKNPKGVLFYNAGGSDQNTVFAWQTALGLHSDFQPDFTGLLEYDLMMMDTRGTWFSNPLNVSIEIAASVLGSPTPSNSSEFVAYEKNAAAMFQSWKQLSSPPGIIEHVGAKECVQDLEMIRRALGYEKINFLGNSYGTFRAAQYADTFPSRVGRFALDAVVPHGLDLDTQSKQDMKAINRGILRADAYCLNNATCPFHGQGKGAVPKVLETVLDRANNGTLLSCAGKSAKCSEPISALTVQSTIYGALQQNPDFPLILEVLAAAYEGNGQGFVSTTLPTIDQLWPVIFICNDNKIEDKTFAAFQKMYSAAEQLDQFNMMQSVNWQVQLICSAWPYAAQALTPISLKQEMLLVTADFDVYDPTERTTFAWKHAPNSALVVRHGDDHVSFQMPYQPSTEITKEFLRTGVLPKARDDTFVTVHEPGSHRGGIPSPYDVPTGFKAGDVDSRA